MSTTSIRPVSSLAVLVAVLACASESPTAAPRLEVGLEPQFHSFAESEWSEPVNLGAPVNSPCQDQTPTLSKDELALYFLSDRPGGLGNLLAATGCMDNFDLWVALRTSRDGPWESAVNLGPGVNSTSNESAPALSNDEHLLFSSNRLGGSGQNDIYLTRRTGRPDDYLAWGAPVPLGPGVNTAGFQGGSSYRQASEAGGANFYFHGGSDNNTGADIYIARVDRDGETRGTAVRVDELSAANIPDGFPTVRADGREVMFNSGRNGAFDLWVSTRRSVHDPWSEPRNLGAPVNTTFAEFQANLSFDGRTLLFIAGGGRGGLGRFDIWMSTRTVSGQLITQSSRNRGRHRQRPPYDHDHAAR